MTIDHEGTRSSRGLGLLNVMPQSMAIGTIYRSGLKLMLGAILAVTATGGMAEAPKHGGVLSYMIPADAGPSLDGHRETTYAVVHATAPFYSVLIRVNPDNLSSTTDFRCDLCTEMPQPTDNGLSY